MPHLVYGLEGPQLSITLGEISTGWLGAEYIHAHPSASAKLLVATHAAIASLHGSTQPASVAIREQIDARYESDCAGAPATFAFDPSEMQNGIVHFLAQANANEVANFLSWNDERYWHLQDALALYMPRAREKVARRAALLTSQHILHPSMAQCLERSTTRLVAQKAYLPLDSFEAAHIEGFTRKGRMYISHLFKDGYYIGPPTKEFWHLVFHEIGHVTLQSHIAAEPQIATYNVINLITEAFWEHCTLVSGDRRRLAYSMLQAAHRGDMYNNLRKIMGHVLESTPSPIGLDMVARGLWAQPFSKPRERLLRALGNKFARVFPWHGEDALYKFMRNYYNNSAGESGAKKWLAELGLACI